MNVNIILLSVLLFSFSVWGVDVPGTFTYQGRVFHSNGVTPVEESNVVFRVQIKSYDGVCVLFEEVHQRNMIHSSGLFALVVGEGTNSNRTALNLKSVFSNSKELRGAGCTYVPAATETRRLAFSYDIGSGFVSIPHDQTIRSVPFAINSGTLQGFEASDFLKAKSAGDQAKIDGLIAKFAALNSLADGNSSFITTSQLPYSHGVMDLSGGNLLVPATPVSSNSAVSKVYTDSKVGGRALDLTGLSNGQTLVWNSTTNNWKASTSANGTVTSIAAGAGLAGGTITSSGTISLSPSGVTAGVYSKISVDQYGRAVAGGVITEGDVPLLLTPGKVSGAAITSGNINTTGDFKTTGKIILEDSNSNSKISLLAPTTLATDYNIVLPADKGTLGQVLTTDGNGNTSWNTVSSSTGVAGIQTTDPRLSDSRAPNGSASGDLGGSYPSPTVTKIQSVGVSSTAPTNNQNLIFNGTNWAPSFLAVTGIKNNLGINQVPTNCTSSQTLTFNSVSNVFDCTNITVNASSITGPIVLGDDSRLSDSRAPDGPASGDLSGSYPSPTLSNTGIAAGIYTKLQVDSKGRAIAGSGLLEADVPSLTTAGKVSGSAITSGNINTSGDIKTTGVLSLEDKTNGYKVSLSVPTNMSADYNLVFPADKGASGQVLTTDGLGNTSWYTLPASTTGTGVQANDPRLSDSRAPNGSASGDLGGSYPSPVVAKIQSIPVSTVNPVSTQNLIFNGTSWAPGYQSVSGIKNASGDNQIPTNCSSSQTLTYNSSSNVFECTNITITDARFSDARVPTGPATGDLDGSYPSPVLSATGVTPGIYTKVQVDAKGRAIAGSGLLEADIPNLTAAGKVSGTAITSGNINTSGSFKTTGKIIFEDASSANKIFLSAPTTLNADYSLVLPDDKGTSGQVLATDGAGNTSWYTLPSTAANVLTNDPRLTDSRAPAGGASGDLGGTYPAPIVAKLQSVAVSTATPLSAQNLIFNGTSWAPAYFSITGIKNSLGVDQIPTNCTAAQTLTFNSVSNVFECTNIAIPASSGDASSTQIVFGNDSRMTDSRAPKGAATGDLSGTYPAPVVAKLQSVAVSSTTPVNSQNLIFNGTSWAPAYFSISGIKNSLGINQIPTNCSSTQTLYFNSVSSVFECTNVTVTASSLGSLLASSGDAASSQIVLGNDSRLTDSRIPKGGASGDLGGSYPSPVVTKIQSVGLSATAPVTAQHLTYNGTVWAPAYLSVSGVKNASGVNQIPLNCTTSQTLIYNSSSNIFECTNITVSTSLMGALIPSSGNANTSQIVLGNDTRLSDARTPTGAASGDLTGLYPSPVLTTTGVSAGTYTKVQVDTKGRVLAGSLLLASDLPSFDWSKITSGLPTTLTGYGITDGVRSVTAGTGLVSASITSTGTLNVDVGTTANKIVQLDSSAKLPAVDASQLLNTPFSNKVVYDTAGTFSWTPPANVKRVHVEVWGAGGGGAGGKRAQIGGAGGGAGAYNSQFLAVTGSAISIKVGAGGNGGASEAAGSAGDTSFFGSLVSNGGAGGQPTSVGAGGTSTPTSSLEAIDGGTGYMGSIGGYGSYVVVLITYNEISGIGGNGGNSPHGGNGGFGSITTVGGAGSAPGGGGGGGGNTIQNAGQAGGAGARGRVVIRY